MGCWDESGVLVVSNAFADCKVPCVYASLALHNSLKNHGAELEVDEMFDLGEEVMGLSLEEKMAYSPGDDGRSFGYEKQKTS